MPNQALNLQQSSSKLKFNRNDSEHAINEPPFALNKLNSFNRTDLLIPGNT